MLKRMKTVIFVIALAIAACNCEGIEVGFTGGVFSQDGYYVSYTSQLLELYASVWGLEVHGMAPGEPSEDRVSKGYRWYINDVLQEGLNGEAITLSYGQGGINRPATYTVKCEVQIVLYGDEGASWTSDWLEVGTRDVTFFDFGFVTIHGKTVDSITVIAGTEEEVSTVFTPAINPIVTFSSTSSDILLRRDASEQKIYITANDSGVFGGINAIYRGTTIKTLQVISSDAKVEVYIQP